MSVQYDIYQNPSADGTSKNKYARPISLGTIDTKQLQSIAPTLSKNSACAYLNRTLERGLIRNIASKSNPV